MMLEHPMNKLLQQVPSRYMLVNVVAQRARQIATEAEEAELSLEDKPVTIAIREVADGHLHVEDENVGENMVVEELQKGYTYKGFVVRHSMVKVAN